MTTSTITTDETTTAKTTDDGIKVPTGKGRGGSPLERVTVNLIPRASSALEETIKITKDTKTDAINRALQISYLIEKILDQGGAIYIKEGPDAELERVRVF